MNQNNKSTVRGLWETETTFTMARPGMNFAERFNQCTFFNYDPNSPVEINQLPLPPATVVTGNVYPTSFTISLNAQEVNQSSYYINMLGSNSGKVWIIYTQYKYIGE